MYLDMRKILFSLLIVMFQITVLATNHNPFNVVELKMYSNNVPDKSKGTDYEPYYCGEIYRVYITSDGILNIEALCDVGQVKINILQNGALIYCDQINLSSGETAHVQLQQGSLGYITVEISNDNGAYSYGATFIQ
jgi:hypothetical protein